MDKTQNKLVALISLSVMLVVSVAMATILIKQEEENKEVLSLMESKEVEKATPSITEQMKDVIQTTGETEITF